MCSKNWGAIEYNKLPSIAGVRYANAFKKNDGDRYNTFISNVDTKVNTKSLYPHDVYRAYKYGNQAESASKYWDNLHKMDINGNILVVSDVSGSMCNEASGKIKCIDISISLGAYLAQQMTGHYHNKLITFSEHPTLVNIPDTKDICSIFKFIEKINWGGTTNLQGTYQIILNDARLHKVSQENMPTHIIILSDMQFDQALGYAGRSAKTIFKDMKDKFNNNGYELPKIIFWNLNASYGNYPTMTSEDNVALVSGFSPSVLKSILSSESFTSRDIMLEAIGPYINMLKD
jgi:hypothetical protein